MVKSAAAALLALMMTQTGHAQGPGRGFGGFGPGPQQDRQLVDQFDRDKNGRLDATERRAARDFLATQPANVRGPGGRRGGFGIGGRGIVAGSPGPRLTATDVRQYGSEGIYDPAVLRTFFIAFENADWEQELEAFYRTDVEVPATVTVDGKTYRDVGIHFRGQSSFGGVPAGSKRSLNVTFDFVNEAQNVGGYRTFNLLNANSDPTFVRAALYAQVARQYIPAPAVNYVRVVINGESWGVYASAQQFNKDFTRDYFQSTKGARWHVPGSPGGRGGMEYFGADAAPYKAIYEIKTRDDKESWNDLIAMFRVLNQTPADRLEAELSPLLDIDGALKFLALEIAMVNSDGYWERASDYSIYQDERGKFHVVPHDMNEGLASAGGPGGFAGPDLDPLEGLDDRTKPLRSKLLAVPALRQRYLGYVRDIATRWLDWNVVGPIVEQRQALIATDVRRDTRKLYSTAAFTANVGNLKSFVDQRRAYLLGYTAR